MAASLALAERAAGAGIETIVATPHIREDYPFAPALVSERVVELNGALIDAAIPVRVVGGGELAISRVPELDDPTLHELCLAQSRYALVESPYTAVGDLLERTIFDLQVLGVTPVLAHPERSPSFLDDADRLAALVDKGILCSVTAASMAGRFGTTVRAFALELFRRGLVHNVASDAHDARKRTPDLRSGFESLEDDLPGVLDQIGWFTHEAPRAMLAGQELPPRPQRLGDRGLRRLIRPPLRRRRMASG